MKGKPGLIATLGVFAIVILTAAVTFDPGTGTGFVGKGDVQLIYNWNNKSLQDNAASVLFRVSSETETTWECTNSNNQNIQERSRTTTIQGVVASVARERNQVTGFNLLGYSGTPDLVTEGPAVNSCPSGPWTLTTPAGDPEPVGGSGLQVSINGTDWIDLT